MLLTVVISKMGLYGFLRILLPIFAPQMFSMRKPLGAGHGDDCVFCFRSLRAKRPEDDFAYSWINHLGYCLLGIFAIAGVNVKTRVRSRKRPPRWMA